MRVLLVTHYFPEHRGGVEIVAGELASRLARRGVETVWMASREEGGEGGAEAMGTGGETAIAGAEGAVRRLPVAAWNLAERRFGFPYPLWGPRALARLGAEVRRADLVHLHDCLYAGNVAASLFARRAGRPLVVTQHIGTVPYASRVLAALLTAANASLGRLVLGGADQVVFISDKVRRHFEPRVRFRAPPLLVPNGVAHELFSPVSEEERRRLRAELGVGGEEPVLLFVGRFVEKKGLALLAALARRLTACRWVFVGWGPDDPAGWGLAHVRRLAPLAHPDLARWYRAADLLVLPSAGEGFPLVVQEAMACGTPAALSLDTAAGDPAVGGVAWAAEPDLTTWTALLAGLLAHPAELAARRPAAAAFARRRWDWEATADRYLALYESLLATRGGG